MSIQEIYRNFKRFLEREDTHTLGLILLVGLSSFGLGRMSADGSSAMSEKFENPSGTVIEARERPEISATEVVPQADVSGEGAYVASKNGTKYHLPWCGGAKQIKEENKVWFATKAEAEAAGYTPAGNCKGI